MRREPTDDVQGLKQPDDDTETLRRRISRLRLFAYPGCNLGKEAVWASFWTGFAVDSSLERLTAYFILSVFRVDRLIL